MGNLCFDREKEAVLPEWDIEEDDHHYNSAMYKFE